MKITVKSKESVKEKIVIGDIKPGIVFEYDDGTIGLKLQYREVILLKYSMNDNDWLDLAEGYKDGLVKRILGRLDEIIVVPE